MCASVSSPEIGPGQATSATIIRVRDRIVQGNTKETMKHMYKYTEFQLCVAREVITSCVRD
jgi:hypothetical protein